MSVRVIIKDVKKRTKACDECKRRKGRCDGGMPCGWCSSRNIECIFSALSQKRGPKKKKRALEGGEDDEDEEYDGSLTLDKRSEGLLTDMELGSYLDLFLKYIDPFFTMFASTGPGYSSRISTLRNPRSYSQFISKYTAGAISARASGNKERSRQLIAEARSFASQAFDDISVDTLIGFVLLSVYWLGTDPKLTRHYAKIALSIFESLPLTTVPPNIQYFMTICSVVLNDQISDEEKMKLFLSRTKGIILRTNMEFLLALSMRMCAKVFSHTDCFEVGSMRSDVLAVLLCQVTYTEAQRKSILVEIQFVRTVAESCAEIMREVFSMVLQFLETFVEWRSGHIERALQLAIEVANGCTLDLIKFGSHFDVQMLLAIVIFLREQRQIALADKVRRLAESLNTLVCDDFPLLESKRGLIDYFNKKKFSAPADLFPVPEGSSQLPVTSAESDPVHRMVDQILSLVAQLLPANNPKALLSSQGLHLMYTTLASLIPFSASIYPFNSATLDLPTAENIPITPSILAITDNGDSTNQPSSTSPTTISPTTTSTPPVLTPPTTTSTPPTYSTPQTTTPSPPVFLSSSSPSPSTSPSSSPPTYPARPTSGTVLEFEPPAHHVPFYSPLLQTLYNMDASSTISEATNTLHESINETFHAGSNVNNGFAFASIPSPTSPMPPSYSDKHLNAPISPSNTHKFTPAGINTVSPMSVMYMKELYFTNLSTNLIHSEGSENLDMDNLLHNGINNNNLRMYPSNGPINVNQNSLFMQAQPGNTLPYLQQSPGFEEFTDVALSNQMTEGCTVVDFPNVPYLVHDGGQNTVNPMGTTYNNNNSPYPFFSNV